jgi:hypothetical protein
MEEREQRQVQGGVIDRVNSGSSDFIIFIMYKPHNGSYFIKSAVPLVLPRGQTSDRRATVHNCGTLKTQRKSN